MGFFSGSSGSGSVSFNDLTDKPAAYPTVSADINDATITGKYVLTAADAPTARTALGAGTSNLALGTTGTTAKAGNYVPTWTEVTSKPTTFIPSAHTHTASQITDFATAVSSNTTVTGKLTASQATAQADSSAADVATLVTDFNALLAKLRTAGIIGS